MEPRISFSFFKDIAGEEAAKSFQALVPGGWSGGCKLLADLRGSQGEALEGRKGDGRTTSAAILKNLDSAGRIPHPDQETTDGPAS